MNREHIIKGLMDALECTEEHARKKINDFECEIEEVKYQVIKQNKRK